MTGLVRPIKITIQKSQIPVMTSPVHLTTFKPAKEQGWLKKEDQSRLTTLTVNEGRLRKFTAEEVKETQNNQGHFSSWSYTGENGPDQWQKRFPVAASHYQSPINIDLNEVRYDEKLQGFQLKNYDQNENGVKLKLQNNGCTVKINLDAKMTITRGDLSNSYEALHMCIHWGDNNNKGSEHLLDGKSFPMEIQIVHRNSKYEEEVMFDKENGLLTLAYFVEIGDYSNEYWEKITNVLNQVKYKGDEVYINKFPLRSLLPNRLSNYFTYAGSLTTPPCNECVTWIVLSDTVKISEQQMTCFRELKTGKDNFSPSLVNNFRPVQKLYRRKITTNNIGVYS